MSRIDVIIFDLDNVLYNETTYIFAAYHKIASYLSKICGIDRGYIYKKLISDFKKKTSIYPRLFNDLLDELDLDISLLPEILGIFSSVKPNIKLYKQVRPLLSDLSKRYKLSLLTNGKVETQKNKVKLLNIKRVFYEILYARELGNDKEKPNSIAYQVLLDRLNVQPKNAVCIGDNPYTDFIGAKKLGILTVRIRQGEFSKVRVDKKHDADITINNLSEFTRVIEKIK